MKTHRQKHFLQICFVMLLAVLSHSLAAAYQDPYEPDDCAFDSYNLMPGDFTPDQGEMSETLRLALGGSWQALVNPITGTAHLAWGSGLDRLCVSAVDEEGLEIHARKIIDSLPDVFGVSSDRLRKVHYAQVRSKVAIIFQQYHDGEPIRNALVRLVFSDTGRLILVGSDADANLKPRAQGLPETQVVHLVRAEADNVDLGEGATTERSWLPDYQRDGQIVWVPVWTVTIPLADGSGTYTAEVDGLTGEVANRSVDETYRPLARSNASRGTVTGHITTTVHAAPGPYYQVLEVRPLPFIKVRLGGNEVYADADGYYEIDNDGTSSELEVEFDGKLGRVYRQNQSTPVVTRPLNSLTPELDVYIESVDEPVDVSLNLTNIYYHMVAMRLKVEEVSPAMSWWNEEGAYRISAYVNPGSCENWGGGSLLSFGLCNGTYICPQVPSIVYHELHHSMHSDIFYGHTPPRGHLKEGSADFFGSVLSGDREFGRGFGVSYPFYGIRRYYWHEDPNANHFPDCDQDFCEEVVYPVHSQGMSLGAFYLDIYEYLINPSNPDTDDMVNGQIEQFPSDEAVRLWLEAALLGYPIWLQDQVLFTFLADDDDDDLTTPSPNQDALCWAATNRNYLHLPGLDICIPQPGFTKAMVGPESLSEETGGLLGVRPNPFNPSTTIDFNLVREEQLSVRIFNVRGELVRTLTDEAWSAGTHSLTWHGSDDRGLSVASGLYFLHFNTSSMNDVRKIALMK